MFYRLLEKLRNNQQEVPVIMTHCAYTLLSNSYFRLIAKFCND